MMNKGGKKLEEKLESKIEKILDNKKAENIIKIDTKEKSSLADYFIIATGTSSTHIKSLSDNIEQELKKENIYPRKIEGYNTGTWILMDYNEVIVNIFIQSEREKYNLEELLEKAPKI